MTRRVLLLGGLGLFASLCGCGGGTGGSGTSTTSTGTSGGEIVIGHFASLTGSEATFGQMTDNGIKLAVEEANAAGGVNGRKVKLVTFDDKGQQSEAGTAVTRLITLEKAQAILGEVASSRSLAGAPVCQKFGVPMITPSSTNPQVTQKGDMIFRVCFIDPFQGKVCAKFARENEKMKVSKMAILYDQEQAYSTGLRDEFRKAFTALGGKITTEQAYNYGDTDFSAQLTTILNSKPEGVFVPGYYTDVGNIAVQARRLGLKVPLLGGDGWESTKLTEIARDSLDGSFYSNHYSAEDPSPRIQNFIKKFKERFKAEPDSLAALGYDAANLLFAAMKRAPNATGRDLAKAIGATKNFAGVTGDITLDAHRNAVKAAVVLEIVKGKPKYVATIAPE